MFHRTDKTVKMAHTTKPLDELVAIVTPSQLLACPKRQELMQKIKENNVLEPARYESIAVRLIHNLINYCQSLPETANSYYSSPVGLFDHALNRTEAAMSLFRQYVAQDDKSAITAEQTIWSYALFSLSMLKDIGKLQTDFIVDLYDTNGQLLTRWNPLLDNMTSVGSYYHHQFQASNDDAFRCRLNLLFAKLIMPNSGFAWIASNMRILKVWLALLDDGEDSGSGTLKAILSRADDIAIQRELNALALRMQRDTPSGRGNRIGTFVDAPESNHTKRNVGTKFIRWVQKELALGHFIINKGPLMVVPGGVVMSELMYKLFVKSHPEYKKWQIVHHGFISLGLHKISRDGAVVLRNDLDNSASMENGIMLEKNTILFPDEVQMADLSTGEVRTVSAIEIIHAMDSGLLGKEMEPLATLSESGHWQLPQESIGAPTPVGAMRGG